MATLEATVGVQDVDAHELRTADLVRLEEANAILQLDVGRKRQRLDGQQQARVGDVPLGRGSLCSGRCT